MKILAFPDDGFLVTKAAVYLFDGTLTASPTIGSWPSGVTGRCKVTLSSVTGHADCAGTITIGSETLTFAQAATKITTTNLTAKPAVSSVGLDCHCHITVIDAGGAPVEAETATATKIQFENTSSGFFTPEGVWKVYSGSYALCKDAAAVDDILRYNSIDMPIKKVDVEKWFSKVLYYIFYL